MKFEIKHRWTGNVLFVAELEAKYEAEPASIQMGAAVKLAVSSDAYLRGADLRGANLSGADLSDAYLRGADLRGANLSGADLSDADLRGAYLSGADLSDADLRGAYLSGAYLGDADLRGAYLSDANLRGAYLGGADLSGADLRGAYLSGAYLGDANLRGAYLGGADLRGIRDDLWAILSGSPAEVPALRQALIDGRVDGSTYTGECACLCGTLANAKGVDVRDLQFIQTDSSRPAEMWFAAISKGDTPQDNQASKQALEWIDQWLANVAELCQASA